MTAQQGFCPAALMEAKVGGMSGLQTLQSYWLIYGQTQAAPQRLERWFITVDITVNKYTSYALN